MNSNVEKPLIAAADERALRMPEVIKRVGVGESTLHEWIAAGHFPRPRRLGPGKVCVWLLSEIVAYMRASPVEPPLPRMERTPAAAALAARRARARERSAA